MGNPDGLCKATLTTLRFLAEVADHPDRVHTSENLAASLEMSRNQAQRLCQAFLCKGWLTVISDHGRVKAYVLTAAGARMARQMLGHTGE
jgi:response regulator of citrate/malate metabolism